MIAPSPDWTPDERLAVINSIAAKVQKPAITRVQFYESLQAIRLVTVMSADFLETNRTGILVLCAEEVPQ